MSSRIRGHIKDNVVAYFTLGAAADFQVTARDTIFFGWEARSFNIASRGDSFRVIAFATE